MLVLSVHKARRDKISGKWNIEERTGIAAEVANAKDICRAAAGVSVQEISADPVVKGDETGRGCLLSVGGGDGTGNGGADAESDDGEQHFRRHCFGDLSKRRCIKGLWWRGRKVEACIRAAL